MNDPYFTAHLMGTILGYVLFFAFALSVLGLVMTVISGIVNVIISPVIFLAKVLDNANKR